MDQVSQLIGKATWGLAKLATESPLSCMFSSYIPSRELTYPIGKRKIIFKMPFLGDMLVPWRVYNIHPIWSNFIHLNSFEGFLLVIHLTSSPLSWVSNPEGVSQDVCASPPSRCWLAWWKSHSWSHHPNQMRDNLKKRSELHLDQSHSPKELAQPHFPMICPSSSHLWLRNHECKCVLAMEALQTSAWRASKWHEISWYLFQ